MHARELIARLDEIFATRPLADWATVFDGGEPDFFWSPINSLDDVVADEQFHAAGGGIVYVPEGGDSSIPMVATPPPTSPPRRGRPEGGPPKLGEHTDEILAELRRALTVDLDQ